MVFAKYLEQKWAAEDRARALNRRLRNQAQMMKWAKEKGIPIDQLPESRITNCEFGDGYRDGYEEGHKQGVQEGIILERQRLEKNLIQAWAEERDIPIEELPDIFR